MTGLTSLPAWTALGDHARVMADQPMRALFAGDPQRFAKFSRRLGPFLIDYSKHRITAETMSLLTALARAREVEKGRAAMFAGEHINTTENRAVLHVALRNLGDRAMKVDGVDVMPEVRETRARLKAFADEVRGGKRLGATGKKFRHIVNIGIGGSHLGPMFVADALRDFQADDLSVAFVSNPDRAQLDEVLKDHDPAATLFTISSKTFTTAETTANANAARAWIVAALGEFFGGDSVVFWGPLSWTIIFGLIFAFFLTLVMVPSMYLISERLRRPMQRFYGSKYIAIFGFTGPFFFLFVGIMYLVKKLQGKKVWNGVLKDKKS